MNLRARYVSVSRLANRANKLVNRIGFSLDDHPDPPVRKVLNRPDNFKAPCYLESGKPEADALNGTGEKNFKSNGRHFLFQTKLQLPTNLQPHE